MAKFSRYFKSDYLNQKVSIKFALSFSALFLIIFLLVSVIFPFQSILFNYLYPKPPSNAQTVTPTPVPPLSSVDPFGIAGMPNNATEQDFAHMGMSWFYDYGDNLTAYNQTIRTDIANNKYHFVPVIGVGVNNWTTQHFLDKTNPAYTNCTTNNGNLTNPKDLTDDFYGICPTDMTALKNAISTVASQMGTKNKHYYIIGNEPNVPGGGDSSSTAPSLYAQQYADAITAIASVETQNNNSNNYYIVGPSMLSWNGTDWTLSDPNNPSSPNNWSGQIWFNSFLNFYKNHNGSWPRIDRLNIHLYNLNSSNPGPNNIGSTYAVDPLPLENQVIDLYNWSQNNNIPSADSHAVPVTPNNPAADFYKNIPIWITEFGIAHCNPVVWTFTTCIPNTDPWMLENVQYLLNGEEFSDLYQPKGRTGLIPFFTQNRAKYKLDKWFLFVGLGVGSVNGTPNVYPINIFTTNSSASDPWPLTTVGNYYYNTFLLKRIPNIQQHSFASEYSGTQGLNNWYYYYVTDINASGKVAKPLSYVPGPQVWFSVPAGSPYWNVGDKKYLMISGQNIIPEGYEYPVLYWKAPANGIAVLTVNDVKIDFNANGSCKGNGYFIGVGYSAAPGVWHRNQASEQIIKCDDHTSHTLTYKKIMTKDSVIYIYKSDLLGNISFGDGAQDTINIKFTQL